MNYEKLYRDLLKNISEAKTIADHYKRIVVDEDARNFYRGMVRAYIIIENMASASEGEQNE